MYKVVKRFKDVQDDYHVYNVGDIFPREGNTVSNKRIEQLAGANNRQNTPLIVAIADTKNLAFESVEGLNLASPVQRETEPAEQEGPPIEVAGIDNTKPKRSRRSK